MYCNALCCNLPKFPINRLRQIRNFLVRTMVKAPKYFHITPILKSRHFVKDKPQFQSHEWHGLTTFFALRVEKEPSFENPISVTMAPLGKLIYSRRRRVAENYTVSQKTCDYIFYNNFNNKCPITIISA